MNTTNTIVLHKLNKIELDQRMKTLAQRERDLLHEVLLTIKEIDSRRTFLELGFGSLFEYLVQGVGYSEGSAQRRIDAARLIREIPQIAQKIQNGELKLNQISLVQKASREVQKTQSVKVTANQKLEVLEQLLDKNHSESQQQVAAFFDLPVMQQSQLKTQADESVRIEFTLSKEDFAQIKHAQELLSHAVPTQDLGEFLKYLAKKVIKQKTAIGVNQKSGGQTSSKSDSFAREEISKINGLRNSTAMVAVKIETEQSRPSIKDVKLIRQKHNCCQYVNPKTGRKCQSTWQLQVDHKHSRWAGGTHQLENLQQLCAGHNKMKYKQEMGIRYLG